MTALKESLCDDLQAKTDVQMATLRQQKRQNAAAMNALKNSMQGYSPSDLPALPAVETGDAEELEGLMSQCDSFDTGGAASGLDSYLDTLVPPSADFTIAGLMSALASSYSKGLGELMPGLDQNLDCLSSVCGRDVTAEVDETNAILNSMHANGDGSLNRYDLGDSVSVDEGGINHIAGAEAQLNDWKSNVTLPS